MTYILLSENCILPVHNNNTVSNCVDFLGQQIMQYKEYVYNQDLQIVVNMLLNILFPGTYWLFYHIYQLKIIKKFKKPLQGLIRVEYSFNSSRIKLVHMVMKVDVGDRKLRHTTEYPCYLIHRNHLITLLKRP